VVAQEDDDRQHDGDDADGAVLASEEGLGTLADGVGDGLHVLRAQVPGDDRAGDEEGGDEREDADGERNPKPDGITAGDRCGGWGIVLNGQKQSRGCAEMHEQVSS
jgi:hypothetical protein